MNTKYIFWNFGFLWFLFFVGCTSIAADEKSQHSSLPASISSCLPEHPHINHTGVYVSSIDETLAFYKKIGMAAPIDDGTNLDRGMRVAIVDVSGSHLELLQAVPKKDGTTNKNIAAWIAKHGDGFNHVALEVPDIRKAMKCLTENGVKLDPEFSGEPRGGATGWVTFTDPSMGTRIEFVQIYPKKGLWSEKGAPPK